MSPEVRAKIAELRTRVRLNMGQVVLAMMNLPRYRHQALADLTHLVLDPMMRDRIAIAHRTLDGKPLGEDDIAGIAIWASVSDSVDAKITEQVKARYKDGSGAELVGKGETELGITQASEVIPVPGVELAGPLPPEIQSYTVFPGAVVANAKESAGAAALLKFLASPEAVRVLKVKGLEPAG